MRRISLIVLLILAGISVFAQQAMFNKALTLSISMNENNRWKVDSYVEGTPYSSKEAEVGYFFQKNKTLAVTKTQLNYLQNNFEFTTDDQTYLVDENSIDSVVTGDKTYVYRGIELKNKVSPRVVEVIAREGKSTIYKFTEVEIKPEVKAAAYVDPKPARYYWNDPVYFIELGDNLISLSNFKLLFKSVPGKEEALKKFIKENKISKTDPDDLKRLLHFINQPI